jgi:alkanesulfonate monooxygenase SsuD/methylene tetrahydromethanopterin reductase-like flavin-dependent oxidoreductase (luciferase family)
MRGDKEKQRGATVEVGILLVFQNYRGEHDDADIVRNETAIATLAEPLGFDKLWCVEHHFTDYAACRREDLAARPSVGRAGRAGIGARAASDILQRVGGTIGPSAASIPATFGTSPGV